ncbi:hypothetical protein P7H60_13720 [Vagococcus carniphilus]|uniref:hypothetical protein n=1 Tax=Vagococcus carniphilus TaxID=218144 RepID=UPI00288D064B|nr:hypothetical protein [Vagococcus carniphilus]MDT2850208.1 hypothetical protein [Vagococcus carniphilus]
MHYVGLLALIALWVIGICCLALIVQGTVKTMRKNGTTEKQAFKRIAEKYPATPKQIENILDRNFAFINSMMEDEDDVG